MKVEIWSDVMCPFCYIGKRRFENALEKFPGKEHVEIEWKSFQLNPELKTDPQKNINQYLAEAKGWSVEKAAEMNNYVTQMAKESGLEYHLDQAIVANSFDAHRLSHLAKEKNVQNELEELLFSAYFTEGKNTADHDTLKDIGLCAGLDETDVNRVLFSHEFSDQVKQDIEIAQQIGVRGVPFFVFNRKYAVSGAQSADAFLEVLNKAETQE